MRPLQVGGHQRKIDHDLCSVALSVCAGKRGPARDCAGGVNAESRNEENRRLRLKPLLHLGFRLGSKRGESASTPLHGPENEGRLRLKAKRRKGLRGSCCTSGKITAFAPQS